MRLIDADAVLERIKWNCDARCLYKDYKEPLRSKMCNCCDLGDARMYVDDAPTVDAEPVVKCKDCDYAKPYNEVWVYPIKDTLVCTYFTGDEEVDDNFFCGCAIKKMDEVEE